VAAAIQFGNKVTPEFRKVKPELSGSGQEDLNMYNVQVNTSFDMLLQPSVAYLVLGLNTSHRPAWSTKSDDILVYVPPQGCPGCPDDAMSPKTARVWEPHGWWCAQRHYMVGLQQLLENFPEADYYFLSDADTMIFSGRLRAMLAILEYGILSASEDLYMGHGFGGEPGIPKFIMSGGGVLVRGRTLRRLSNTGQLQECAKRHLTGDWCWHHLDWVMAECLLEIEVEPSGHPGFQQFVNVCPECCNEKTISCHPVADRATLHTIEKARGRPLLSKSNPRLKQEDFKVELETILEQQLRLEQNTTVVLNETWAGYCENYDWFSSFHSKCC